LSRYKLPKTALLRKGREFDKVYRQGKRCHGKGFSLIFSPNELGFNRLGISIHRKLKGAVKRNRIKRIIRESFRLERVLYPECMDIVFAVRPDFTLTSPAGISSSIAHLLKDDKLVKSKIVAGKVKKTLYSRNTNLME